MVEALPVVDVQLGLDDGVQPAVFESRVEAVAESVHRRPARVGDKSRHAPQVILEKAGETEPQVLAHVRKAQR